MCHYCGCRQIPLIRAYIAERERATSMDETALRDIDAGRIDDARRLVGDMADDLRSHRKGEEDGIFPATLTEVGT